jgi:UDP-2,3-diacylglucosamine pyrophosphatase LpxH
MAELQLGRTLFVSDLHLRGPSDPNQGLFLDFLESRIAVDREATLVIVGDLFDFWFAVGQEVPDEYREVVESMAALPRVVWLEGNHDIGQSRSLRSQGGLQVRSGDLSLRCGELLLHVSHGDRIDGSDLGHRLWRDLLDSTLVRTLATLLGSPRVQAMGRRVTLENRRRYGGLGKRNQTWLAAAHQDACRRREEGGVDLSVRGHGHFLGWWPDGLVCLGDWLHFHSYLEIGPSQPGVTLRRFRSADTVDQLFSAEPVGELALSDLER